MIAEQQTLSHQRETKFWTWKGHQINYTVVGDGPPLLLIHGFGASIGHWRNNIPTLAAGGYRVWAIDLLGFGGSDKAELNYSLELWQEMITDFWHVHINKPTIFIGNSIGALLSLMLVANHPEISRGAVLINSAGGLNHRPNELNLPLRTIMGLFTRIVSSEGFGPFVFNLIREKKRIRNTLRQVYTNHEAITDELVDLIYLPSCDPGAQKVFASIVNAPPGPQPSELLPQVNLPLLVLWGTEDPWTPISGSKIYQNLATQGKPIKFIPIPNTGHCPHDERPTVVNPLILDWLSQL